jgi:hypothetical protein
MEEHDADDWQGVEGKHQCAQMKRAARHTLDRVQQRITDLHRMERVLRKLIRDCEKRRDTASCPILSALDPGGQE